MITKILFSATGLYILIGVVLYFINLNKPPKDRPIGFIKGSPFHVNPLSFILFSPIFLLTDIFAKFNKKKQNYINVNASEEEKRLYNLGTTANSQGDYKIAIEYFSKVIKMNPNFSEAHVNRGTAYSRLRNPDAADSLKFLDEQINNAILDFDKAIELDPKNGYAYYNRAVAKWMKGVSEEAVLDIKKAKELGFNDIDPDFEKSL